MDCSVEADTGLPRLPAVHAELNALIVMSIRPNIQSCSISATPGHAAGAKRAVFLFLVEESARLISFAKVTAERAPVSLLPERHPRMSHLNCPYSRGQIR